MTVQTQRPLKLPTKSARARAESKALWNEARSPESADFFTLGYEGRTTKDMFDALRAANVQCVIDIRYNPVSMYRPELSKGNLQKGLQDLGLAYFHLRDWGVPRDVRARAIESGTRETIWEWYDQSVVEPNFQKNLHRFLNFGYPVAMLCMECDPTECHRHRIFMALENQGLRGFDL
ncbi:MAG TPA: DUF488 domain-containing protein [Xanthobacteraceae bacterium]|nr:DUF488 domain-containing protein [Xanthobacteraceae bacterium]